MSRIEGATGGAGSSAEAEPVFHAPWQAKAFALVVSLQDRGVFTSAEWAEELGRACSLRAISPSFHPASDADQYYAAWLEAMEVLVAAKGAASRTVLSQTGERWKRAAAATPHGQPIELRNAD